MNILRFFIRFVFRHLLWFMLGPLAVGVLVYLYSKSWVGDYAITTTIYTGVASSTTSNDGTFVNTSVSNSNLENLISIIRSRATLERVSMYLFAQSLIYGDPEKDNLYISASTYRSLIQTVPDPVKALIDKSSVDKTVENLFGYLKPDRKNYLYGLLNWDPPFFSITALQSVNVSRLSGSDMLEISYTCSDAALGYQTLVLLNKEFMYIFSELRYKDSNEMIRFFEREVASAKSLLDIREDSLLHYNMSRRIVNYGEQTKALAGMDLDQFVTMKTLLLDFASSSSALSSLDAQLEGRASAFVNNTNFMSLLRDISALSTTIVRAEMLLPDELEKSDPKLQSYKKEMERLTQELKNTTQSIQYNKDTKEGISMENVINEWLTVKVANEKAKASIEQLNKQQEKLDKMFTFYSPIGATLTRSEREISVAEQTYLQLTQALISARLRLKNLQMSLGTVSIVTPPVYPLASLLTNRRILVFVSMIAALILIISFFLIVELVDHTLRSVFRTERLIEHTVDGVIPSVSFLGSSVRPSTSRESDALKESSARLAILMTHKLTPGKRCSITVGSVHPGDGKSLLCRLLEARFSEMGYQVAWIRPEIDYAINTRNYFAARNAEDLLNTRSSPMDMSSFDIFLIELTSKPSTTYPGKLLSGAAANIMVLDSERGWNYSEKEVFRQFVELSGDNFNIVLNRGSVDDMEMFTSLLPPKTWLRKIRFRLMNMELTSRWDT